MENNIRKTILKKGSGILNVYVTAGYPRINDTQEIVHHLVRAGVDLIELGMPYSDPLADGKTIQDSSTQAIKNGITIDEIFSQVADIRINHPIPIILMGYFNQLLQYGVERFLSRAEQVGVDGMIIPDLPMNLYESDYKSVFEKHHISISFLISPHTDENRIRQADRLSSGFIYVISQTSITGLQGKTTKIQSDYFEKIQSMNLSTPQLIGFGIHDHTTYAHACKYSHGAIIGSAFIRALDREGPLDQKIAAFIQSIRGKTG